MDKLTGGSQRGEEKNNFKKKEWGVYKHRIKQSLFLFLILFYFSFFVFSFLKKKKKKKKLTVQN